MALDRGQRLTPEARDAAFLRGQVGAGGCVYVCMCKIRLFVFTVA
jgi:hypothetical protein